MNQMLFYHGAKRPFNRFSFAHVDTGSGAAQEGVGFYLTSSIKDAAAYGDHILTVAVPRRLKLVPLTGKPNRDVIITMVSKAPDVKEELLSWGDTPQQGLMKFVNDVMKETPHGAYQSVWYAFYRYNSGEFVKNMAKMGFDGVLIKKRDGVTHLIGFNPFKLKIVGIRRKEDIKK